MTAGLYVIWSKNRKRAYVGESIDLDFRKRTHRLCMLLADCTFEVEHTFPISTPKRERMKLEYKLLTKLKRAGVSVVNQEGWHEHMLSLKP